MKVGFACGVFDLYHAGHALMLKECKKHCDYLIVALNRAENLPDSKNPPVYSIEERVEIMESIKYVDEILIYNSEKELSTLLANRNIDIRFLGDDYRSKPITSPELSKEILFLSRDHGYSTSRVRRMVSEQGRYHSTLGLLKRICTSFKLTK